MKTIPEDTPIIPHLIADSVCAEAGEILNYLNPADPPADRLVARAERHYRGDGGPRFAKKVRSASGREFLYSFMRHWLAAMLLEAGCPRTQLPPEWVNQ